MKKTYIKPTVKILHTDFEGIMADPVSHAAVKDYNGEDTETGSDIGTGSGDNSGSTIYHTKGVDLWDDWEDDDMPL